ncbi:MAG: hypothetical protein BGO67_00030 [Alphaproteobacteria bacterium 41-28]|nr:MAG: hypothetical protein BGO67_00030 [Alphaproteobacteria bacterium 41-28]
MLCFRGVNLNKKDWIASELALLAKTIHDISPSCLREAPKGPWRSRRSSPFIRQESIVKFSFSFQVIT